MGGAYELIASTPEDACDDDWPKVESTRPTLPALKTLLVGAFAVVRARLLPLRAHAARRSCCKRSSWLARPFRRTKTFLGPRSMLGTRWNIASMPPSRSRAFALRSRPSRPRPRSRWPSSQPSSRPIGRTGRRLAATGRASTLTCIRGCAPTWSLADQSRRSWLFRWGAISVESLAASRIE